MSKKIIKDNIEGLGIGDWAQSQSLSNLKMNAIVIIN
jgi:hypothetical protein